MNAIFVSLVIPRLKDDYFANVNMLILDIQGPVLRSCWLPNDGSRFPPTTFQESAAWWEGNSRSHLPAQCRINFLFSS